MTKIAPNEFIQKKRFHPRETLSNIKAKKTCMAHKLVGFASAKMMVFEK